MGKVKLPREVAEALKHARVDLEWEDGNILAKCVRGDWDLESMQILNNFCKKDDNKLTIAKALVNGYEVEQTPEERIKEAYKRRLSDARLMGQPINAREQTAFADGIKYTLNELNIKIEGVNA